MTLSFSARPGRHERHLKRKHRNPLFPDRDQVTADEVSIARLHDEQEREAFLERLRALVGEAVALSGHVDAEEILRLKDRCDALYEEAARLGGDQANSKGALVRLTESMMRAVSAGLTQDPEAADPAAESEARERIAQEEAARREHYRLLEIPLVADLLDPESVITPEELTPTLLSEPVGSLQQVIALFQPEQLEEIQAQAQRLLEQLQSEGVELIDVRSRLAVLEGE